MDLSQLREKLNKWKEKSNLGEEIEGSTVREEPEPETQKRVSNPPRQSSPTNITDEEVASMDILEEQPAENNNDLLVEDNDTNQHQIQLDDFADLED